MARKIRKKGSKLDIPESAKRRGQRVVQRTQQFDEDSEEILESYEDGELAEEHLASGAMMGKMLGGVRKTLGTSSRPDDVAANGEPKTEGKKNKWVDHLFTVIILAIAGYFIYTNYIQ